MKILLLLAMLGMLVCSSETSAVDLPRSCPGTGLQAPCIEFWRFDTVFIGTVQKLVKVPFPEGPRPDWQAYWKVTATLTVEEVFRGKLGAEAVFEMEDCYFEFKQDEKYLVYTNKGESGKLHLRRYQSRTRLLSDAGEDLDFIRSLPATPPGGRVFGHVFDSRRAATLRLTEKGAPSDSNMPGVILYLRNAERTYETTSDATGQFEFTRVPPGRYELSSDLPAFLVGVRHALTVIDKGCVQLNLSIEAAGEIKGRLLSADGEPVEKAIVSIFLADGVTEAMLARVRAYSLTRAETKKDGSFAFARLQSGRYYLAVNMVNEERVKDSPASDYPRTFYPGVPSFIDAKQIILADGAKWENVEIKLPGPRTKPSPNP